VGIVFLIGKMSYLMVSMLHMIIINSHMMVPTITLLDNLFFYLNLIFKKKLNNIKITLRSNNVTYDGTYITFYGNNG
jgi:hypothetical protein